MEPGPSCLRARSHWVCRAHLNRGEDGAADAEGWFNTGDVATIDLHGCVEMVDLSKDVIKSGGKWISSIQLENVAVSHPDVTEAAIIAARHPKWMERPSACGAEGGMRVQSPQHPGAP